MAWLNPYTTPTGERLPMWSYVLRFPVYCGWCLWGFLRCWLETRHWSWLLQGLPAIGLATLLGLTFVSSGHPASPETIASYLNQAKQAIRDDDLDRADFYFRKLATLAPDDADVIYEHALLDAHREKYDRAAAKMSRLLNDDSQFDDMRVHQWLAEQILAGKIAVENREERVKQHLNEVLAKDSANLFAHRTYAQLCLQEKDIPAAIKHLEPVAPASPQAQLLLAALYRLTSDNTRMRMTARRAQEYFSSQVHQRNSTELDDWHKLAEAHVLLDEFDKAVEVLSDARTRFNQDGSRRMLAEVNLMWSDHEAKTAPDDVARQMELLQQAFLLAPDDPKILQRLQDIALAEGPAAEEAQQRLKDALAEGHAPGVIHFLLGTSAAMKGDDEAAIRHFNQSIQKNPRTAVTLNNLAFVMTRAENPDLQKALELADQAVRYAPLVASFRETRGQILVRLKRYTEGISDLEFALPQIQNPESRQKIHLALEQAYRELGDTDLSNIHRQKANELAAEKAPATSVRGATPKTTADPGLSGDATPPAGLR